MGAELELLDRCPDCGEELEENYIKDDLVDGVMVSVSRMNCLSCGFTTIVYEYPRNSPVGKDGKK